MSIYTILTFQILILILVLFFVFKAYKKMQLQKINQNKLIEKYKSTNWNRININSPNFHEKILKNKGYEFGGILINNDFDFKIIYINDLNQEVIHNFYKDTTKIKESNSFKTSNLHWISIQDKNDNLFIVADTGINAQDSKEKTADLINKIYSNVNDFKGLNSNEFSLEKNKASIIVMFLIFGLIFGAIFSQFLSEYKALVTPSFIIISFALSFLAMPAYFIMKKHKVPVKEAATLTILLMIGINYSSGLILKGISTIGKKEEFYKYQINTKTFYLKDPKHIAPPIKVWRYKDYWAQYENESEQTIKIIKGPLDLWFYNRKDLENKYKEFYKK